MPTAHPREPLNTQIVAEACEWLVEFESGDAGAQVRQDFDAWLRQSPEHVRAYLELLPIWKHGADTQFARDAGPAALIAYARTEDNVVSLDGRLGSGTARNTFSSSRRYFAVAAAVAVVALGAAFAWRAIHDGSTFETGIGEQHSAVLVDGSTLELNALSKVRMHFTERERRIDLVQGQALFRVAKDQARPFIVDIDGTRVRALGTQFDIYRKASGTIITVLEGRVQVSSPLSRSQREGRSESSLLSAGEQITVGPAASKPKRANLAATTAWTQRRLVFDASTLGEVVGEFNRYNRQQLVIHDRALDTFPISAAFSSTDPASLVRFLEAQPGIEIRQTASEVRISKR